MLTHKPRDPAPNLPRGLIGERRVDRDKLAMVSRSEVAHGTGLALHQLQFIEDPEVMVMGVATLFALFCMRTGMDPRELHDMGKRVLTTPPDGDKPTDQALQSLKDFVGARVMAQEVTIG